MPTARIRLIPKYAVPEAYPDRSRREPATLQGLASEGDPEPQVREDVEPALQALREAS